MKTSRQNINAKSATKTCEGQLPYKSMSAKRGLTNQKRQWSLEPYPVETATCECGERYQIAAGLVWNGKHHQLAVYRAALSRHGTDKRVTLSIGLRVKDGKGKELQKVVSLIRWNVVDGVATSVVTNKDDSTGLTMTREEALGSPSIGDIWEMYEFIADNDPYIRPFLAGR